MENREKVAVHDTPATQTQIEATIPGQRFEVYRVTDQKVPSKIWWLVGALAAALVILAIFLAYTLGAGNVNRQTATLSTTTGVPATATIGVQPQPASTTAQGIAPAPTGNNQTVIISPPSATTISQAPPAAQKKVSAPKSGNQKGLNCLAGMSGLSDHEKALCVQTLSQAGWKFTS